jgi:hypothetical protein
MNAKLAGDDESALSSDPTVCQCVRLRDGGGFKRSSILFNRFHWAPFQRTGFIIHLRLNAASKIKRKNLTAPLQRQKPVPGERLHLFNYFFLGSSLESFSQMAAASKSPFFAISRPLRELSIAPVRGQNGPVDAEILLRAPLLLAMLAFTVFSLLCGVPMPGDVVVDL